jgi:hypothetical protein
MVLVIYHLVETGFGSQPPKEYDLREADQESTSLFLLFR